MSEEFERQSMDVDIVCVGFGPAMGGFLTTLSKALLNEDGSPRLESQAMPGMPLQIICYERADDIGVGVSGVLTRGRGIKASYDGFDPEQIPMAAPVRQEKLVYLLDPIGASRRPALMRMADAGIRALRRFLPLHDHALELPYIPPFLRKHDGFVMSIGQFNQWVGTQLMGSGMVQIWPGMPVSGPLIDGDAVVGVRLVDQGVDRQGNPDVGFMPGMDIKAPFTVVGDGPVGAVGRALDTHFGLPSGKHQREWAVGMKMVVELPDLPGQLEPGTVLHTLGFPEPGIFGFLYVYPERVAALGIFIPSWFDNPVRTGYRYLQHWMQHPYLWRWLKGGTLRSWGAKSLQESGLGGEPKLAGNGYARIGEGSGSTNVLTGSGVDEAWSTGVLLAEAVVELMEAKRPLTRENLEQTYVRRRRQSWVETEARVAARSRDGFQQGVIQGLIGMAMAGFSGGQLNWPGQSRRPHERIPRVEEYFRGKVPDEEIERIRKESTARGRPLHDALMDQAGWPSIAFDGKLLISHQDALLRGGKVQAPAGYADHVRFRNPGVCAGCHEKICIEACSGQAISMNPEGGVPLFDREKCVHCGACLWNCSKADRTNPEQTNIDFLAGAGGLHSVEN